MDPSSLKSFKFHTSRADTWALFNVVHYYVDVHGRGGHHPLAKEGITRMAAASGGSNNVEEVSAEILEEV
jgi:hypothetical protein